MRAKEYLEQLQKLNTLIENKYIEIEQWKAMALSSTASSESVLVEVKKNKYELQNMEKVQSSSGSQQKMADAIGRYLDIEEEIRQSLYELYEKKKEIISVIEQLNAIEYNILFKMYVGKTVRNKDGTIKTMYMAFDEIAELYNRTYSWATTMHGRALKNVQDILNKRDCGNTV